MPASRRPDVGAERSALFGSGLRALLRIAVGLLLLNGAVTKFVFDTNAPGYRVAAGFAALALVLLDDKFFAWANEAGERRVGRGQARRLPPQIRQLLYAGLLDIDQAPPRESATIHRILDDLRIPRSPEIAAYLSRTGLEKLENELSEE